MNDASKPPRPSICVGVISGTSMDGIDVAALRTDGVDLVEHMGSATYAYPDDLGGRLLAISGRPDDSERTALDRLVADVFAEATTQFLRECNMPEAEVAVVGSHGQTVWHDPAAGESVQLCDCQRLADLVGVDVVGDFRQADVAAGGQGAPLTPLYHHALAAGRERPVAFLNLGGVGNVTYVGADDLLAFDTGPANAMIDDLVRSRTGRPFDKGGSLAASGIADQSLVAEFLRDEWFGRDPPKSLDRNHFSAWSDRVADKPDADAAATLTAMTVASVKSAAGLFPAPPVSWLVCGGGRSNSHMMWLLDAALPGEVSKVDDVLAVDGEAIEAEAFAYLAKRSLAQLPLSLPTTTGVPAPTPGGRLYRSGTAS